MSTNWLPPPRSSAPAPARPALLGTSSLTALVIDTSGSMHTIDDGGTLRRIDRLTHVLRDALAGVPSARCVVFGDRVEELHGLEPGPSLRLPEPAGGTPLHSALELVAAMQPRPGWIVVISDGMPDDNQAALAAARALKPAVISALYVGPDGNKGAIGFMRTLALMGSRGGVSGHRSLASPAATKALAQEIAGLLAGPAR